MLSIEGKIPIEELCNPDRTLHIDSKVLGEGRIAGTSGGAGGAIR